MTQMADAHVKHHDYHLVDPSPWPALGSISAFIMAVGAICWMHALFAGAGYILILGIVGVLYTMFVWWRDVVREADKGGYHPRVGHPSPRCGTLSSIAP